MRIFLTGVSCIGKSTIGKILADRLCFSFFDLDDEIEKYFGTSIERLRSRYLKFAVRLNIKGRRQEFGLIVVDAKFPIAWEVIVHFSVLSMKAVFEKSYLIHALPSAGGLLLDIRDLVQSLLYQS